MNPSSENLEPPAEMAPPPAEMAPPPAEMAPPPAEMAPPPARKAPRPVILGGWLGSIGSRLVLALTGVSLLTLVVVGALFYAFLGGYVVDRQKEQLLEQATQVSEQVQVFSSTRPNSMVMSGLLRALLRADLRTLPNGAGIVIFQGNDVVARGGVLPVGNQNVSRLREEGERVGGTTPGAEVVRSVTDGSGRQTSVIVAAAPIISSNGSTQLVVVTLAISNAVAARGSVVRVLVVAGLIAVAFAIALGLALGLWMGRPLRRLSAAARGMAAGRYDQPVTGTYPGEVQELATSLETMRQEVRHSEESLRAFVGSAAHELRTPLTSIEGFSQALLDGTAASEEERQRSAAAIYRESTRLRRLVDALLTLSRYDSGEFHPSSARISMRALVEEEVERLVQTGLTGPDRIRLDFAFDICLVTDIDMLRQVVANLLTNAVQYGGEDPIQISAREIGRDVILTVGSGGTPLTPEEKGRIFERFFRGRQARGREGFGLGLALVREICGVLGGKVELVEGAAGGPATVFRVTLPVEPVKRPNMQS
ncbi:MAG: HAMP domain-containing histidine kinase [Actinobacteria bacterium]|nr:HAMP domain-containing histidine kinase [Actinomycetota bacterium]